MSAAQTPGRVSPHDASFGGESLARARTGGFGNAASTLPPGPLARPAPARPQLLGRRGFLERNKQVGQVVGEAGAQATALLGNLTTTVKKLEDEIVADERSLQDMDRDLVRMRAEAKALADRITQEEAVVVAMSPDQGMGAAFKHYDAMFADVKQTYSRCRDIHKDSIDILKNEFGYNPAYKRGKTRDEFTGVYHSMARDPAKLSGSSR
mmetsp:Transcript_16370/g.46810  ORF Transcript_16370/g.46810 Transcript_16370/m.46810 type:complete len:209 (+) Transcript_16370:162-788(+)